MNKIILVIVGLVIAGIIGFLSMNNIFYNDKKASDTSQKENTMQTRNLKVTPVSHASMILEFNNQIIYNDPVGGVSLYSKYPSPNIILLSDIHGDHLDSQTLKSISTGGTTLVLPQSVADEMGKDIPGDVIILSNGEKADVNGISIESIPMYNIPESNDAFHTKGRGNGYVLEANGERVYIAGDTGPIDEMKNLQNIDVAFIPMNLPYTMDVDVASEAVLAFKPKVVHPYHYRGPDGLSDVNKFKELVESKDPNIRVELLNFYPE